MCEVAEHRILGVRWQAGVIESLQHTTEAITVELFEEAQIVAIHAKRMTIIPKDIAQWVRMVLGGCEVIKDHRLGQKSSKAS